MCGVRHDSCSHKHKYVRTSHGMGSESKPCNVGPQSYLRNVRNVAQAGLIIKEMGPERSRINVSDPICISFQPNQMSHCSLLNFAGLSPNTTQSGRDPIGQQHLSGHMDG